MVPLRAEGLTLIFHAAVLVMCKENVEDEKQSDLPALRFLGCVKFHKDALKAMNLGSP